MSFPFREDDANVYTSKFGDGELPGKAIMDYVFENVDAYGDREALVSGNLFIVIPSVCYVQVYVHIPSKNMWHNHSSTRSGKFCTVPQNIQFLLQFDLVNSGPNILIKLLSYQKFGQCVTFRIQNKS